MIDFSMSKKLFTVVKWNGETELFQPDKLLRSLMKAGATEVSAQRILQHMEGELHDGMHTSQIYEHAFKLLKNTEPVVAARYDLKKALMRLGPSGYPFERFIGHMWQKMGYEVKTGVIVPGSCIEHEVDVVAENDQEILMMECKYHNYHDTPSDIKTALYVHARMEDLKKGWEQKHPDGKKFKGYLVTNTKLSTTATQYAECVGLHVLSWSYPQGAGLAHLIDKVGLHPITCLTTLTEGHIRTLLNEGYVLCREMPEAIHSLRLKSEEKQHILQESKEICEWRPKNG